MILDDLRELNAVLTGLHVSSVVVGGASIERLWFVGTSDIYLAVTLSDYSQVLNSIRRHPRFRNVDDDSLPIAGSEFQVGTRMIDVEFINPRPFCGLLQPDDFIDYVRRQHSIKVEGMTFAEPEVVWYMRLIIPDWIVYVQKIIRDVRAGVPLEILKKVLQISRHFGNEDTIRPRIEEVRKAVKLLGPQD